MAARKSSENVTSRFCNHFSIIQSRYASKMSFNYLGVKLEPLLQKLENKFEHLSSYAHVVHTTAIHVISRRRKRERLQNVQKWKMHVQSVQNYCFLLSNMQIIDILVAVVDVVA